MLYQYIGSSNVRQVSANAKTFAGRRECFAKKLTGDVIDELVAEPNFVRTVDSFIKNMLSTYPQPQADESRVCVARELLTARGELLANCGRYLLKIGHVIEHASKKAIAKREVLPPNARIKILEAETKGKLNKLEDYYRK